MAAIGIDLGTTFSCVGAVVDGKVVIIPNKRGNYITPSCVAFTKDGVLVGEDARANLCEDPNNTIISVKRIIGLHKDDPEFKSETANLPYKVTQKDGETYIEICVDEEKEYYLPEEISGKILSEMKAIAEDYLGEPVDRAVITIPARFNHAQREKTRIAAEYAHLKVLRLLHEPTAAALAYGLENEEKRDGRHVLVYDLGGGTFDVNILALKDDILDIKASAGNTHLGGEDFDQMMVAECFKEFAKTEGVDLGKHRNAKYRLREACEKTKIALSFNHKDTVTVRNIMDMKDFNKTFTRAKFEYLNDDSLTATMGAVESALRDAKLTKSQIGEVVLAGGSTRIPYVRDMLRKYFGKHPCMSLDADQAVAYGAAICAAHATGNVTAQLPKSTIRDVVPLSIGTDLKGGVMSVIIKRNTQFPTCQSRSYTTVSHYQTRMKVSVYEGERAKVALNHLLDSFTLDDIPPQLAGKPSISVTFEIDIDGLLHVSARDKSTGTEKKMVIQWQNRRLDPELTKLQVQLAEVNEEDDAKWRTRVLTLNELESDTKKLISIISDSTKLTRDEQFNAIKICVDVLDWLKKNPEATLKEIASERQKLQQYRRFLET